MATLTIQIDDSQLQDAIDIGVGMKEAGRSEHAVDPEHVLHSAITVGLAQMKPMWPRKPAEAE